MSTDSRAVSRTKPYSGLSKPQVSKKMPAPFSRPSITIGGASGPKREWRTVRVVDLREGDIVPGIGRLYAVAERIHDDNDNYNWTVLVTGGLNLTRVYAGNDTVWAFTVAGTATE